METHKANNSHIDFNERENNILKSGKWWEYPWWLDRQYYKNDDLNINTVKTAICRLKNIFDSSWIIKERDRIIQQGENFFRQSYITPDIKQFKDQIKKSMQQKDICEPFVKILITDFTLINFFGKGIESHPLFDYLVSYQGKAKLLSLVEIGSALDKINMSKNILGKEKFIKKLKIDLKDILQYPGAVFELKCFSVLDDLKEDFDIEYEPELSGKNPDFKVSSKSGNLIIELKAITKLIENDKVKNKIKDVVLKAEEQIPEGIPALVIVGILDLTQKHYIEAIRKEFKEVANSYKNVSGIILYFNKPILDPSKQFSSNKKTNIYKLDFIKNEYATFDISNHKIVKKIISLDNFTFR